MTNLQLITIIPCLLHIIISFCCNAKADEFRNCSVLYSCGSLKGLGYPFFGADRPNYCGRPGYGLFCVEDQYSIIRIHRVSYRILEIDISIPKMKIARQDLWNDICPGSWSFFNYYKSSGFNLNGPADEVRNLRVFYGCSSEVISKVKVQSNITCSIDGAVNSGVFFAHEFVSDVAGCMENLVVPIQLAAYNDLWDRKITLAEALKLGYDVQYTADLGSCSSCETSGGRCGSDSNDHFICICPNKSHGLICTDHGKRRLVKLAICAAVTVVGVLSCLVVSYFCCKKCWTKLFVFQTKTGDDKELEAFIKQNDSLKPRRYSYNDIKKMTNNFKEKIGQGGFGEVYKGNLPDKRPVAVKILNSTKENGDEFINEISSISKTSHVNVVTLLGYCLDGFKRALVYEFMSNGSLEKYIHPGSGSYLGLERLYGIAIGIGKGLDYLHGGCNTRILHFDIKPHNILLDEDFCPKISDFGLAKLCAPKESIVSMFGARGTIGYIAPEVFSRNFGKVSNKSDVYSYGMMVVEMVVGRTAITQISEASETYFPDYLYDHILIDEEINRSHQIGLTREENDIARKMILVGLWCIQINPLQRPTMNKVIDMLEGDLKSLEVPPKPYLCSPSRSESANLGMSVLPPISSSFSRSDSYS